MAQPLNNKQPQPISIAKINAVSAEAHPKTAEQVLQEMQAEVSPEAAPLWQFVNDHARTIAIVVVGTVAIIITYALWQGYREKQFVQARKDLSAITVNTDSKARLAALETFLGSAHADLLPAVQFEIAKAAIDQQDFPKAQKALESVIAQEKNSPLGYMAHLSAGDLLMRQGKNQEAISQYESILANLPQEVIPFVQFHIAEAAEAAGQKDKAKAAYSAAINALPPDSTADISYYKARMEKLN